MSDPSSIPPTQLDALKWVIPYLLILLGGPAGVWGIVKAIAAFRDWLKDTRSKAERAETVASKAATDLDGLGGKVSRIDNQQERDRDRFVRIEKDHEKTDTALRDLEKTLPDKITKERHDFVDRSFNPVVLRIDGAVADLKEDHGRRLEKLEDKG